MQFVIVFRPYMISNAICRGFSNLTIAAICLRYSGLATMLIQFVGLIQNIFILYAMFLFLEEGLIIYLEIFTLNYLSWCLLAIFHLSFWLFLCFSFPLLFRLFVCLFLSVCSCFCFFVFSAWLYAFLWMLSFVIYKGCLCASQLVHPSFSHCVALSI